MNNISNIEINGTTYSIKDAEARENLKKCITEEAVEDKLINYADNETVDEKIEGVKNTFNQLSIEQGTGTLSLQSKEWVGDDDEEPRKCSAEGLGDVSLGLGCYTNGKAAIALGKLTSAPVSYATALGIRTTALGTRSTILGFSGKSAFLDAGITENSTIEEIIASWLANSKNFSLAKGLNSFASIYNCLALGRDSYSSGLECVAVGTSSRATGSRTTALFNNSWANGAGAVSAFSVLPLLNTSMDKGEVYNAWLKTKFNLAFGSGSLTYGWNLLALGKGSSVFGYENVGNDYSSVFGYNNIAGAYSLFSGKGNTGLSAPYSLVSGSGNTLENAERSNVLGRDNNVLEGGNNSIFGYNNNISNSNYNGILGSNNKINKGDASFVIGAFNVVNYTSSHVIGRGLISNRMGVYLGRYNLDLPDTDLRFVIGKGKDENNRANLMEYRETSDALTINANEVNIENIVLTSPNGTKFKLSVADDGSLITEKVA